MGGTFANPVLTDGEGLDHGDPFVLKFLDTYYLYHTGRRGVQLYTSADLVHWEYRGVALAASDSPRHWAQTDLWAPEVLYHNGTFYMYVAATRLRPDGSGDDALRRLGLARSDNPLGPFAWDEAPLIDEWSIDGHPFRDDDGSLWLYYNIRTDATRYPDGTTGCGNVVQRLSAPDRVEGPQFPVTFPTHRWEGNADGTWYWNEGPWVLKRRHTYYQMYSGGWFGDGTYAVGFATAPAHRGPWSKHPGNPIFRSTASVIGPGHHCVVKAPDGVTPYAVYHARVPEARGRKVHIDRFFWAGDRPVILGPTESAQPYPPRAVYDAGAPAWHLSAWVRGAAVRVGGVAVTLPTADFHLLEATKRDGVLRVTVDGVVVARGDAPGAAPEVAGADAVLALAVASHLDDDRVYTLPSGAVQTWAWHGTTAAEVALACRGSATVRAHGRGSVRSETVSSERYELVRFFLDDGLEWLEVVAGDGGAEVADVVITAREAA